MVGIGGTVVGEQLVGRFHLAVPALAVHDVSGVALGGSLCCDRIVDTIMLRVNDNMLRVILTCCVQTLFGFLAVMLHLLLMNDKLTVLDE